MTHRVVVKSSREAISEERSPAVLVLSRKAGERIQIGDDIELEIVKTNANRVKLCISAPSSVQIRRAELKPATTAQGQCQARRVA